jgi:hypothetical protein
VATDKSVTPDLEVVVGSQMTGTSGNPNPP